MNNKHFEELYSKAHQLAYNKYFPLELRKADEQLINSESHYIARKLGRSTDAEISLALTKRLLKAHDLVNKYTLEYLFTHKN